MKMSTDAPVAETEDARVLVWRHDMLRELGLTEDDADFIAHSTIDWHSVEALIHAGCPVRLAVEIAT
jgi:hypothetical protein